MIIFIVDKYLIIRYKEGAFAVVIITFSWRKLAVGLSTSAFHASKAPLNIHISIMSGAIGLTVCIRVVKRDSTARQIFAAGPPLHSHLLPPPWEIPVPHLVGLRVKGMPGSSSRQSISIHLLWECPWLAVLRIGAWANTLAGPEERQEKVEWDRKMVRRENKEK